MNRNIILLTSVMAICAVLFVPTESIFAACEPTSPNITNLESTDTTVTVTEWNEGTGCRIGLVSEFPDSTTMQIKMNGVMAGEIIDNIHHNDVVLFDELNPNSSYTIFITTVFESEDTEDFTVEGETITTSSPPTSDPPERRLLTLESGSDVSALASEICVPKSPLVTSKTSTDSTISITWNEGKGCTDLGVAEYPESTTIRLELDRNLEEIREGIDGNGDVHFEDLTPDTTYDIFIITMFEDDTKNTTIEITATTTSVPVECEPTYPYITDRSSTDSTITITWDEAIGCNRDNEPTEPDYTDIRIELGGEGETKEGDDGVATFEGLLPSTTYNITIIASFDEGELITETTWATTSVPVTCTPVPPIIESLDVINITTIVAEWYEAIGCENGEPVTPESTSIFLILGFDIVEKDGSTGYAQFDDLEPDTTYTIAIIATFDDGSNLEARDSIRTESAPVECTPIESEVATLESTPSKITTLESTDTTVHVVWNEAVGCSSDNEPISPDTTSVFLDFDGKTIDTIHGITDDRDVTFEGLTPDTTYGITIYAQFYGETEEEDTSLSTTGTITTLVEGDVEATIEDEAGQGSNDHHTRPTFGIDHETFAQLVDGGFTFNDNSFDVIHNFWTPFPIQTIKIGDVNTFSAKVYADKGLNVQEFLFGIPQVGDAHKAELGIEVFYNNLGEITLINVVQKSEVIDTSTLVVTNDQVKCTMLDIQSRCQVTYLEMVFLEPLLDDVMAIKAIDFKGRSQITYLNDGFDISGDSLNPMITRQIAGPEKYEGPIEVAQTAKYSNIWESNDGRLFESNESYSFEWINQTFERTADDGTMRDRMHSGFASLKQSQADKAIETLLSICPKCLESFTDFDAPFSYAVTERIGGLDSPLVQQIMSAENEKAQKIMYTILNPIQQ